MLYPELCRGAAPSSPAPSFVEGVTAKDADRPVRRGKNNAPARRYSLGLPANRSIFDNQNPAHSPKRSFAGRLTCAHYHREATAVYPEFTRRGGRRAGRLRVRVRRKVGFDSHLWGICTTQTGAAKLLATTRYIRYRSVPPSQHRLNRFSLKDLSAAEEGQKRENQLRRQRLKSDKTEHCIT
jgi:hypothetical protein